VRWVQRENEKVRIEKEKEEEEKKEGERRGIGKMRKKGAEALPQNWKKKKGKKMRRAGPKRGEEEK
jgi:hypothetical protein